MGVDLIEVDVRSHRGRLEVRHSKTMGPVPLLWDRWSLEPGWRPRLLLEDVLDHFDPETELMLDIKRGDSGFPVKLREAMRERAPGINYSVCSQFWELLEPFRDEPGVRVIHSVGNSRMLRSVVSRMGGESEGIAIHQRLLTEESAQYLLRHAKVVLTWPVNDEATFERLRAWGVNGFIIDSPALLARVVDGGRQA